MKKFFYLNKHNGSLNFKYTVYMQILRNFTILKAFDISTFFLEKKSVMIFLTCLLSDDNLSHDVGNLENLNLFKNFKSYQDMRSINRPKQVNI